MTRHQTHVAHNRNRAARSGGAVPSIPTLPMNLSAPGIEGRGDWELEGRMTQAHQRNFEWQVRAIVQDPIDPVDLEQAVDKVNQLGPYDVQAKAIVTHNDYDSYVAALGKRSNFLQEGPSDDISPAMLEQAIKIIDQLPRLYDEWDENELDRARWLGKFDDGKRARMVRAWDERDESDMKEMRAKTGSVKIEVLCGKRDDQTAAGRIIYAGSDLFNTVTGPAQMVMMERLVQLLSSQVDGAPVTVGDVEVMLGYKTDDINLCKFIIDPRYREIVEGDFSRNDREQRSKVATICDKWCEILGMPVWYRKLLLALDTYTLTNREFGIRVQLMYQLATGTTNTTFRNSTYNMTMFAVVCKLQKRRGKALVLGDDLLAALNKRLDLKLWVEQVAEFKMVLKAKAPTMDGQATFLSRRIFADVETPFMIPLLGKMLARFNLRAIQNECLSDSAAMAAKALSYAFGCKNCHLLRDIFLERFEMEGGGEEFDVEELGWMARSNGYTVEDILRKTNDAPDLVDFDQFSYWCSMVYDADGCEVLDLFRRMILSTEPTVDEDPIFARLAYVDIN